MKINTKVSILVIITIVISSLVIFKVTQAAVSLDPLGIPSATMKTLENIYQKIVMGTDAVTHNIYPSAQPAGTMHTLTDIYNAIPGYSEVCSGVNAGEAYCDPVAWSPLIGQYQWSVAKAYCENPANGYTRLPTLDELAKAFAQQYFEGGSGPAGFNVSTYYLSNNDYPTGGKGIVAYNDDSQQVETIGVPDQPESLYSFRCVR